MDFKMCKISGHSLRFLFQVTPNLSGNFSLHSGWQMLERGQTYLFRLLSIIASFVNNGNM